ncbi:hypothetical protein Daura_19270 [Dactylosporangium aurantiacum]|uniref:Uncharacterized protein n=1 Tax=Dactylosporangium aurantiacum TaxID=35754 RepID=A0A9Q9IQR5_9ACTN|nr:hypothetical protein [Dactylosporangium aurantiacum]MDG6109885.1 hypothetical protein [Dactylosporangium aurantiacum]UWZ58117.1 hypothetical protein Daura_19270 [Dactylosporangium aurantiacum]
MGLFKRRPATPVKRLMAAAGLPTAGGEIPVGDVVMEVARRGGGRAEAALAVVEELLGEGGDAARVATGFLEDLQNVASHGAQDLLTPAELRPLRGPRTVDGWDAVDRFWAGVVAWCVEQGVELEPGAPLRDISDPGLRSIMWLSCRSLPDGRRVSLADVVRYERATGTPMRVLGPHSIG